MEELGLRTLHVKHGKTGVLDYVFERYLEEGEARGLTFTQWVESDAYDPVAIKADFRANWWGTLLTEKLVRRE
jgi:protein tyrosine/serine phosphatase